MIKQKRWVQITELLKAKEDMKVEELITLLGVSPATLRRDLQEMEDMNIIKRYHGGARLNHQQIQEPAMILKSEMHSSMKKQIGYTAAKLIKDNQMIYLDAGSTTYEMLDFITAKNITIVTPSIAHLPILCAKKISTIVLGGNLRSSTQAITGKQTLKQLENYYFDACFIGTNGIHEQVGFTTSNESEAETKTLAISHSKNAYIVTDSSKFNLLYPVQFAQLKDATIICDTIDNFDKSLIKYYLINGEHNYSY